MFYLTNPNKQSNTIFPPSMKDKICVDFTCKGGKCLVYNCTLMHPRRAKDMDKVDFEAIARHFKTTKMGWLSSFHFANLDLSPEAKSMFGDDDGIASKPC